MTIFQLLLVLILMALWRIVGNQNEASASAREATEAADQAQFDKEWEDIDSEFRS